MSPKTIETKLYDGLYHFFEAEGFRLLREKKQFRKGTPAGFINIILSVAEYEKDAWLEVHIGCRNEQIEQIAQQFLNTNPPDFRADANTLVISTGRYNDVNYFRYKIQSDEDLRDTCASIRDFMLLSGWVFLKTADRLTEINRILNTQPGKPCKYLYNQTHRCFKGLIAAKLTDNPRYHRLTEVYRAYINKYATETERINYERLVAHLQYYGPN